MNNSSSFLFLGTPRYHGSSGSSVVPHDFFLWLLTHLAVENDWVDRKDLAELLWQDTDLQAGLNNLRQLLYRNKKLEWAQLLEAKGQALRIGGETDVSRFRRAFERNDWQAALHEYGGALLEGVRPLGLPAFETWLEAERSTLQHDWREALIGRTQELAQQNDLSAELFTLLEQLLEVDPYNEEALLSLLQHAVKTNRHEAGLRLFEIFRGRLKADLGVEPLAETLRLADQLSGKSVSRVSNTIPTFFVGRDAEQALILSQLEHGAMRLLTLRGSGGVGKTTLAQRIFDLAKPFFSNGTTWVSLQAISQLGDVPLAIAASLELKLKADSSVWSQISDHLRHKNTLLILDNLEQLRGIAERLAELLEAAAGLKILVTSRVSLELPGEVVCALEGLDYPETANLALMQTSSAVLLFVERAALRRGGFALTEQNMTGVLRICKLVSGLPLGLTLAAAWAAELSPNALADGLESNADLPESLESEVAGVHRSLKAVFEHSWELLEDDLRTALSALSLFCGGFERRAALTGIGVSARALLGLVGRSLLQSLADGRYDLHPSVQVFAAQKLEQASQKQLQVVYAQYFARQAEQAEKPLRGGANQARFLKQITADLLNYFAAIQWTAAHDVKLGAKMVGDLVHFWYSSGHRREGLDWANQFLALYQAPDTVRLRLLWTKASLSSELAEYDATTTALEAHEQLALILQDHAALGGNQMQRGLLARARGQLETAKSHLQTAIGLLEQSQAPDPNRLANYLNHLGGIYQMQQDSSTAKNLYQQSLALKREIGDSQGVAYALANLGTLAGSEGNPELERALLEEALIVNKEIGDAFLRAWLLQTLGKNALKMGDLDVTKHNYLEAFTEFIRLERRSSAIVLIHMISELAYAYHDQNSTFLLLSAASHLWEQLGSAPRNEWAAYREKLVQESRLPEKLMNQLEQQGQRVSLLETLAIVQEAARQWHKEALQLATKEIGVLEQKQVGI